MTSSGFTNASYERSRLTRAAIAASIACVTLVSGASSALAQAAYPSQPIKAVIPYPPGGNNNTVGRIVLEEMSKKLGQPIVVENRAGAAGKIGTGTVVRSPADGYTLLYMSMLQYMLNDLTDPNLQYKSKEDLVPVSVVNFGPVILVASKKSGIKTVKDLMDKSKSTGVHCGSPGAGGSSHIWCVTLVNSVGGKFIHVPYDGVGPQIPALLRGDIDFTFETYPTLAGLIASNEITAVAVLSDKRLEKLPDVPAMTEVGYPQFAGWKPYQVIMVPKGTPKPIIDKLSETARSVMATPEIQKKLADICIQAMQTTPEESLKLMLSEFESWGPIVEKAGVKVQ